MPRYISWADVQRKYPLTTSIGGASEVGSTYINRAEYQLDGILGTHFTVPFSSNNETIKDLAIDLTYMNIARGKDDRVSDISSDFYHQISMLKMGEMVMMTSSGGVIAPDVAQALYSKDMNAQPIFDVDGELNWGVDSSYAYGITYDR